MTDVLLPQLETLTSPKQVEDDDALKKPESNFEGVSSICSFGQGCRSKSRLSFNLMTTLNFLASKKSPGLLCLTNG